MEAEHGQRLRQPVQIDIAMATPSGDGQLQAAPAVHLPDEPKLASSIEPMDAVPPLRSVNVVETMTVERPAQLLRQHRLPPLPNRQLPLRLFHKSKRSVSALVPQQPQPQPGACLIEKEINSAWLCLKVYKLILRILCESNLKRIDASTEALERRTGAGAAALAEVDSF